MSSDRLSSICKNQKNERGDTAKRNLGAPTVKKKIILSEPWNIKKIMKQNHKIINHQTHFKYEQGQA